MSMTASSPSLQDRINGALGVAEQRFFTALNSAPATDVQIESVTALRHHIIGLAAQIDVLVPDGHNKSLALTALEDVQMRANRGIFAEGVAR